MALRTTNDHHASLPLIPAQAGIHHRHLPNARRAGHPQHSLPPCGGESFASTATPSLAKLEGGMWRPARQTTAAPPSHSFPRKRESITAIAPNARPWCHPHHPLPSCGGESFASAAKPSLGKLEGGMWPRKTNDHHASLPLIPAQAGIHHRHLPNARRAAPPATPSPPLRGRKLRFDGKAVVSEA